MHILGIYKTINNKVNSMNNLKEIKILVEDFKSNNHTSWIKFDTERLRNKSKNLWKPITGNKEIIDLLDGFIVNKFNFEPLGKDWSENDKKYVQSCLEFALSCNMLHGFDAWSKKKAKELTGLILESFKGEVRYFSNVKKSEFFLYCRHNDPRSTDQEYGVIIYDRKNICGIWI